LIEIFDLFEIEFICSLVILVCFNDLIERRGVVTILIFEIVLICYNNKWRHRSTIRIDVLDYNNLFSIIKLYIFNLFTPVIQHYNKSGYNLVYKKAYLVKILNIGFYNTILSNYILGKSKPNFNDL